MQVEEPRRLLCIWKRGVVINLLFHACPVDVGVLSVPGDVLDQVIVFLHAALHVRVVHLYSIHVLQKIKEKST